MISKEEFMKVWKDSSRESILNQFYYDYKTLREVYDIWSEFKKYIDKNKMVLNNPQILDFYLKMIEKESE